MSHILLIKTSSLGDVVHNLPVVADIRSNAVNVGVDWVVEESFAAIPRMHPSVGDVIPVAMRRWRKSLLTSDTRMQICAFIQRLRSVSYDAVIDTQGLLKSAVITRAARGERHGLDWKSSREPLRWFYDHVYAVPWGQHAVQRNRSLVAQALGYVPDSAGDYGISAPLKKFDWLPAEPFIVLLHATSADNKLWPEAHWIDLARKLAAADMRGVLPWGSETERARALRLAQNMPDAIVPPMLDLTEVAALLGQAKAIVGVDTGLTHLAAALGIRTIGIYCATDPAATGVFGCPHAVNLGDIGTPPSVSEVLSALDALLA